MKNYIVLILLVGTLLIFSGTIFAADWDLGAGYIYTTLGIEVNDLYTSDFINSKINEGDTRITGFKKIDALDNADGFFISFGTKKYEYDIAFMYENFSNEMDGYIQEENEGDTVTTNLKSEIDINGFLIEFGNSINEYFTWSFGIGRYSGDLEEIITEKQNNILDKSSSGTIFYNLEEDIGFKFGAQFDYPFDKNWRFNAKANYRLLNPEYEINKFVNKEDGKSSAPSQTIRNEYSGKLDLDGYEVTAGLSYIF